MSYSTELSRKLVRFTLGGGDSTTCSSCERILRSIPMAISGGMS